MKNLFIILSLLIFASCGKKKVTKVYHVTDSEEITKLRDDLTYLSSLVKVNGASINSLETTIRTMEVKLAELETKQAVISIYDPCGDDPNHFDEVLLVLSSGEIVAYFEQGNNRFLTVLEDNVNYRTTDHSKCKFVIHNGIITEGEL